MSFKLRPYQKSDYKQLKKELKKHDHILFGASVGYGKSIIVQKMVKDELKKGGRVLVITPRRKLTRQLLDTLEMFTPSILMGSDTVYHPDSDVFCATTPTLNSRMKKQGKKLLGDITLILYDEVHISFNGASMEIVKKHYWDTAKWVGLSGTPIDSAGYRLEGWDHTIYNHQMQDLIDSKWLTPMKVLVEETPEGLEDVGIVGGDYNEQQLAAFMSDEARVSNVYEVWSKYARKRKTMIFAVNIAHAEIILEDFRFHKVSVDIVHSNIHENIEDIVLEDFKNGNLDVLVNVGKLTAGYDNPIVDCLIVARPSKSTALFLQIVGRSLRLNKGKKDALLLDVAGVVKQHGYPTMRRDFNKVRPPQGASNPIEFNDVVCPFCDYSTQPRNCRREQIVEKHITTTRTYCPNCDEIIDEKTKDAKEIKKMELMKDPSNVSDKKIGKFVEAVRAEMDYKEAWVGHIARRYNNDMNFKNDVKMIYARHINGKANLTTCGNNLRKLKS